jgi:hypothetical protein
MSSMGWLFANATRRVYRCRDGTVAMVWWDAFGANETYECLEHGVARCQHVKELRAAAPPGIGVPTRPDPRMFETARP